MHIAFSPVPPQLNTELQNRTTGKSNTPSHHKPVEHSPTLLFLTSWHADSSWQTVFHRSTAIVLMKLKSHYSSLPSRCPPPCHHYLLKIIRENSLLLLPLLKNKWQLIMAFKASTLRITNFNDLFSEVSTASTIVLPTNKPLCTYLE